jgi:riboflavin biosynthesis pyrimidine reductase
MVGGLDGSAAIGGRVGALSTAPDAAFFKAMRVVPDVVLVGAETVRRERYGPVRLDDSAQAERTARGQRPVPPLAVVSRSLDFDWSIPMFSQAGKDSRSIVLTCAAADPDRVAEAERTADVVMAGEDRVEPARALAALGAAGHQVVLCEGGPTWLGELAAEGLLDELCLTIAPLMGGDPLPVAVSPPGAPVTEMRLRHALVSQETVFLRYESAREGGGS